MELETFKFWCQKVLPLVYDDSLSYYEILCKVVNYINNLIEQDKIFSDDIENLKRELEKIQKWIAQFDYDKINAIIENYLKNAIAKMIIVSINENGYIVYYIPENWNDITFNTSMLDIDIEGVTEFGRLVLSY